MTATINTSSEFMEEPIRLNLAKCICHWPKLIKRELLSIQLEP